MGKPIFLIALIHYKILTNSTNSTRNRLIRKERGTHIYYIVHKLEMLFLQHYIGNVFYLQ